MRNYIDESIVRNLFADFSSKARYKEYAALTQTTIEQDKEIIQFLLKKVFDVNKDLEHHLEEIFINFDDDFALLLHITGKYIESFSADRSNNFFSGMDIWEEEKKFALDLLAKTIQHSEELIALIEPNLKNWEMDRVAVLDLILMKMAICELKFFPTVPVKVSKIGRAHV